MIKEIVVGEQTFDAGEIGFLSKSVPSLLAAWGLEEDQISTALGGVTPEIAAQWQANNPENVSPENVVRMLAVFKIYDSLLNVFETFEEQDDWLKTENGDIDGLAPIELVIEGDTQGLLRLNRLTTEMRYGEPNI